MAELNNKENGMTAKKGRTRKTAPKVDLTAMVDLAFLLITFFMLTTSLNKPNALDVAVPDKNMDASVDIDEKRIINLIIHENSYSLIYGNMKNPIATKQHITAEQNLLTIELNNIKQAIHKETAGKNAIVLIKPTQVANTGGIIHCFDDIRATGIKQYMLSKLTKEEEQYLTSM